MQSARREREQRATRRGAHRPARPPRPTRSRSLLFTPSLARSRLALALVRRLGDAERVALARMHALEALVERRLDLLGALAAPHALAHLAQQVVVQRRGADDAQRRVLLAQRRERLGARVLVHDDAAARRVDEPRAHHRRHGAHRLRRRPVVEEVRRARAPRRVVVGLHREQVERLHLEAVAAERLGQRLKVRARAARDGQRVRHVLLVARRLAAAVLAQEPRQQPLLDALPVVPALAVALAAAALGGLAAALALAAAVAPRDGRRGVLAVALRRRLPRRLLLLRARALLLQPRGAHHLG
mmetsp:Transcript_6824/g.24272  ORF Transcript_6824/g.24272 Transcript_6824/m.24272 type:complete len:300 (-) Transcript_6824:217-1116(-)